MSSTYNTVSIQTTKGNVNSAFLSRKIGVSMYHEIVIVSGTLINNNKKEVPVLHPLEYSLKKKKHQCLLSLWVF